MASATKLEGRGYGNEVVLTRLSSMEEEFRRLLTGIEERLEGAPDAFLFFRGGMDALKQKCGCAHGPDNGLNQKWFYSITNDKDLGYPHRKILDFLGAQYCPMTRRFKEVHYSKIVKNARLCTRRAKEYLELLVRKNYLHRTSDGYRVYYRVAPMLA